LVKEKRCCVLVVKGTLSVLVSSSVIEMKMRVMSNSAFEVNEISNNFSKYFTANFIVSNMRKLIFKIYYKTKIHFKTFSDIAQQICAGLLH